MILKIEFNLKIKLSNISDDTKNMQDLNPFFIYFKFILFACICDMQRKIAIFLQISLNCNNIILYNFQTIIFNKMERKTL